MKLLMDEHIDPGITRGLRRALPELDIQTVQEADLQGQEDDVLLAYAAREGRVMVSRDRRTMGHEASQRINRSEGMPGLILIRPQVSLGDIIRALELVVVCSDESEMDNSILYIPL
jgi:predicted nuclease of predicted toxin-antitoxin system